MDNQNTNLDNNSQNVTNQSQTSSIFETNNNNTTQNMENVEVKQPEQKEYSVMRENENEPEDKATQMADKTINAVENFMNTDDHKEEYNNLEIKKYKTSAALCYIPLVPLYFVVTNQYKKSQYLQFNANQGLMVTIGWVISFFVTKLLSALFTKESMLLNNTPGWVSFISYILYCICIVASLFGIINTVNGSVKELPLIGKIKLLK